MKEWNKPKQNIPMKERIGTIGYNIYGSKMIVDEYNKYSDVWVRFLNTDYRAQTTWNMFLEGKVKNPYDLRVYGVGYIGEGKYKISENKKLTFVYNTWNGMLQRCYDEKFHNKHPSYKDSRVCEYWLNFQNFASWCSENYYEIDGQRMNLDKDILVKGNKIYSPDVCVFVPQNINKLFTKTDAKRGDFPIGVTKTYGNILNPYIAQCNNGMGKQIKIGYYDSPEKAFLVYKDFKEKIIKQIAEEYKNKIPNNLYKAMMKYKVEITD